MNAALREIQQLLNTTDLLIEVRDARIPLSSRNPQFTPLLAQKPRIVVYNKSDLAGLTSSQRTIVKGWESPNTVLFQSSKQQTSISNLLQTIKQKVEHQALSVQGVRILVLGMPNVGKSTILNALRHISLGRSKAAKTGAQPGITRSTNSIFKVLDDPIAYLVDTPGIMIPFVPNSLTMLKLGLVHCVKDSIVDPILLADYLLYELNLRPHIAYTDYYKTLPTNEIHVLLDIIGKKHGKLKKGGEIDIDASAKIFIQQYRDGKFGAWCLDEIYTEALRARIDEEGLYLSKSQIRRGAEVKVVQADH